MATEAAKDVVAQVKEKVTSARGPEAPVSIAAEPGVSSAPTTSEFAPYRPVPPPGTGPSRAPMLAGAAAAVAVVLLLVRRRRR